MNPLWSAIAVMVTTAAELAVVIFIILYFTFRAHVPGFEAQARSALYVATYDDALERLGVRYRERGRLTGELRANIAAAAVDAPVREVLERMGPPRELARGVAARRRGPSWIKGSFAALVAFGAQFLAAILMQLTFLSTIQQLADPGQSVAVRGPMGLLFEGSLAADGGVQSMGVTASWWVVAFPLVVFILWSRPWRLLTARASRHQTTDSVPE